MVNFPRYPYSWINEPLYLFTIEFYDDDDDDDDDDYDDDDD